MTGSVQHSLDQFRIGRAVLEKMSAKRLIQIFLRGFQESSFRDTRLSPRSATTIG